MNKRTQTSRHPVFLGIEAGGTRTVAAAIDGGAGSSSGQGAISLRREFGPANLRLISDEQLARHWQDIATVMPKPVSIGIGMAGARNESDRERIRRAAARVWPGVPCYATGDLETALRASEEKPGAGRQGAGVEARVLVLSGTGSCCFGLTPAGRSAKVGGWGHLLGDKGSGYEIGLRALKAVVYYYDCEGVWSVLGRRMLRALHLNEPDDLIGWVQIASKTDIAALALEVFEAAAARDQIARDILAAAASGLARDAAACARRLVKAGRPVEFVFAGSVLLKQPRFAQQVSRELRKCWPHSTITRLKRESVWGAVELARLFAESKFPSATTTRRQGAGQNSKLKRPLELKDPENQLPKSLTLSPTEQRHPRSMNLDKLPLAKAIVLMLREDGRIPAAILKERTTIEQAVKVVVRAFRRGGRLFYVGAGTSGRLGILDASECPPTFRTNPELVQGIIAGGQRAIWEAVEGAEDDPAAGGRAIEFRSVGRRDVVIGIAASGRTPFVWGALAEAKRRRATTVLLCFNPHLKISSAQHPDLVIAPEVGPEILTGSTRLKAGTATKLILNVITTLAMVRWGKVLGNLMIDVKASNTKLRDRAVRIVQELTGAGYAAAQAALEKVDWKIKPAIRKMPVRIFSCRTRPAKK